MKTTFVHLGGQGLRPLVGPALGPGSFRRIVDVPFETWVAAVDSWQLTAQGGEVRFGDGPCAGRWSVIPARLRARSGSAWPGCVAATVADETGHRPLVLIVDRR
jgi:hypothetical protein